MKNVWLVSYPFTKRDCFFLSKVSLSQNRYNKLLSEWELSSQSGNMLYKEHFITKNLSFCEKVPFSLLVVILGVCSSSWQLT